MIKVSKMCLIKCDEEPKHGPFRSPVISLKQYLYRLLHNKICSNCIRLLICKHQGISILIVFDSELGQWSSFRTEVYLYVDTSLDHTFISMRHLSIQPEARLKG